MLFYNGSKLESVLNNLKNEIKKTDYEKIIEPYQKRIKELEKKVYILTQDMESLYSVGKGLINSIDKDYLEVIINIDEPKAYFKPLELTEMTIKRIAIPIKQDLLENYMYWINYYESKYKLGGNQE